MMPFICCPLLLTNIYLKYSVITWVGTYCRWLESLGFSGFVISVLNLWRNLFSCHPFIQKEFCGICVRSITFRGLLVLNLPRDLSSTWYHDPRHTYHVLHLYVHNKSISPFHRNLLFSCWCNCRKNDECIPSSLVTQYKANHLSLPAPSCVFLQIPWV